MKQEQIIEKQFPEPVSNNTSNAIVPDALKLVNDESNRLISWSLLIIGGSMIAVLSKDFLKLEGTYKLLYLLCIAGWVLLALSIYYGELITRGYLARAFVKQEFHEPIQSKINRRFSKQINFFIAGVAVFAIWMISFLLFWIFDIKAIYYEM